MRTLESARAWDRTVTAATALASLAAVSVAATRGPAAALAVALLGGAALAVVARPERVGWAVAALVPVTSGLARGFPLPGIRVSEALVVLAAVVVLPRPTSEDHRWRTLDLAAAGYVGAHVAMGLVSGTANHALSGEGVRLLMGPVQFFLLYRIVVRTLVTPAQRRIALALVIAGTLPVAAIALAQAAGVGAAQEVIEVATRSEVFDRWGWERQGRATGPFASWHPLAGYLFLPLVASIVLLTGPRSEGEVPRPLVAAAAVACTAALLASQTLNVIGGVVLAVAIAAMAQGRFVRVALPSLVAAAGAFAVFGASVARRVDEQVLSTDPLGQSSGTPQTVGYRFEVWREQFLPVVADHWITGYGPELPPSITWRSTESLYITLALRGGIVLLVAFAVLWVVVLRTSWRARDDLDPCGRTVALTLLGTAVALVPMHVLFPYFTASGLPQVFWVFMGLVAVKDSGAEAPAASRGRRTRLDRPVRAGRLVVDHLGGPPGRPATSPVPPGKG